MKCTRICKACEKYFVPRRSNSLFCSEPCRSKFSRLQKIKRLEDQQIKCSKPECGKFAYIKNLCKAHYSKSVYKPKKDFVSSCKHCSKEFQTNTNAKKFCSISCGITFRARLKGIKPKQLIPSFKCEGCGELFKPFKSDRSRYCSRDCYFLNISGDYLRTLRIEKAALKKISKQNHQTLKSTMMLKEIASLIRIKKLNKEIKKYIDGDKLFCYCKVCNIKFVNVYKKFKRLNICESCKQKKPKPKQNKNLKRIYKARRRAIERGLFAEHIDPLKVFKRDKWQCHLCGVKTPAKLRGTYDPNAPELDHIVTLKEGGTHTHGNVACCCRSCNIKKGSTSKGQLKFF